MNGNVTGNLGGLGDWIRQSLPAMMLIVLALVQQIPFYIPDVSYIVPSLVLGGVFYWSIYRPDLIPTLLVFLLGIFDDIMTSQMMGMNAFILLIAYGLCQWQRRFFFKRSFAIMWWGMIIATILLSTVKWILSMILYGQTLSYLPVFFTILSTIAVYPVLSLMCSVVQNRIPDNQ